MYGPLFPCWFVCNVFCLSSLDILLVCYFFRFSVCSFSCSFVCFFVSLSARDDGVHCKGYSGGEGQIGAVGVRLYKQGAIEHNRIILVDRRPVKCMKL